MTAFSGMGTGGAGLRFGAGHHAAQRIVLPTANKTPAPVAAAAQAPLPITGAGQVAQQAAQAHGVNNAVATPGLTPLFKNGSAYRRFFAKCAMPGDTAPPIDAAMMASVPPPGLAPPGAPAPGGAPPVDPAAGMPAAPPPADPAAAGLPPVDPGVMPPAAGGAPPMDPGMMPPGPGPGGDPAAVAAPPQMMDPQAISRVNDLLSAKAESMAEPTSEALKYASLRAYLSKFAATPISAEDHLFGEAAWRSVDKYGQRRRMKQANLGRLIGAGRQVWRAVKAAPRGTASWFMQAPGAHARGPAFLTAAPRLDLLTSAAGAATGGTTAYAAGASPYEIAYWTLLGGAAGSRNMLRGGLLDRRGHFAPGKTVKMVGGAGLTSVVVPSMLRRKYDLEGSVHSGAKTITNVEAASKTLSDAVNRVTNKAEKQLERALTPFGDAAAAVGQSSKYLPYLLAGYGVGVPALYLAGKRLQRPTFNATLVTPAPRRRVDEDDDQRTVDARHAKTGFDLTSRANAAATAANGNGRQNSALDRMPQIRQAAKPVAPYFRGGTLAEFGRGMRDYWRGV